MNEFIQTVQPRWSDIDANFHLRHSVYYDWATMVRVNFLYQHGLTADIMIAEHFGPILFREECIFKREVKYGDAITVNMELIKSRKDYSRWSIRHEVIKDGDTICAIVVVDAAWMDTIKRKLTLPSDQVKEIFRHIPVSKDFTWSE